MIKSIRWGLLIAGFCLVTSHQTAMAEAALGNPDSGKKKFYTCEGCHSITGQTNAFPTYHVPKVGGQHAEYIVAALKSYASGARSHGSMVGNAVSLSEDDQLDIASYLTRFRSVNESLPVSGNIAAGKQKAAACAGCHGEDGNPPEGSFPRLASQYESYLIKALNDYKSGARKNPLMSSIAGTLSEEDIRDISSYYASQSRGLIVVKDHY